MVTYKQEEKQRSRIEIWTNAIDKLTTENRKARILEEDYLNNLISFCWNETLPYIFLGDTRPYISRGLSWVKKISKTYTPKKPEDLKIAFFCGPEPENDLEILLNLGISIENIWAFEIDGNAYNQAINTARASFPKLKIFPGSVGEFFKTTHHTFDIIYLDFVGSLLTKPSPPIAIINSVFDNQALSDLGVLIVNSCEPDANDENSSFLAKYFLNHQLVESSILNEDEDEDEDDISYFTESPISHGHDYKSLKKTLNNNFSNAYSAFSTHYVMYYASMISPTLRFLQNSALKRQLFNEKKSDITKTFEDLGSTDFLKKLLSGDNFDHLSIISGDRITNSESYPFWNFIDYLDPKGKTTSSYFKDFFKKDKEGVSILYAAQFRESFHTMLTGADNLLSQRMLSALPKIMNAIPDYRGGLFCDIPMAHLWLEVALNQLGAPYHSNVKMNMRWKYKAKVRTMHTDLFVFDRCRGLYDSLPMIDQYETILTDIEEQIFARCCIDIIGKQCRWSVPNLYFGSNLICINDSDWSGFAEMKKRQVISD